MNCAVSWHTSSDSCGHFLALLMVLGVVFCAMSPEALRARTRWALVTPALIALNVTIFVLMLSDAGAPSDPATLAGWGGNFWLRTRNGREAAERFRGDRMTAEALALLIDRTIIPELRVTDSRLKALVGVPEEHQPLVANTEEYVRLRSESWRLRSEWLRKADMVPRRGTETAQHRANSRTIAMAAEKERAALEALERSRPAQAATP